MGTGARTALALAGLLGGFLSAAGPVTADDLPGTGGLRSVTWTTREDFEGGALPGRGGTLRRNIDSTSAPGDILLRRKGSSWQTAAPKEKLFDSGSLNIGLRLVANSATGEYLAVWGDVGSENTSILAQRVSARGIPVGAAQVISSGPHYRGAPRLAWDAGKNRFLAVYLVIQGPPRLMGRLLRADGTPVGREVAVADCVSGAIDHDLLWVPEGGGFLLVWSDQGARDGDLFARRIGDDGLPKGKPFLVSGRPGNQTRPRLISRRKPKDLVVVFEEELQGRTAVSARRLDSQGSPAGEEFVVSTHKRGGSLPAAACAPGGDTLLVAWDDQRWVEEAVPGGVRWDPGLDPRTRVLGRDLYTRVFAGEGLAGGEESLLAGGAFNQTQAALAARPERDQILAVWQDGRRGYENWDIYAAALEVDGTLGGEEVPLGVEAKEQMLPVVAYNMRQREFLAAWEDAGSPRPVVYCRRIAATAGARGSIEGLRADSGSLQTFWSAISWNADLPEGAALRVLTRTAEEEVDLAWASWSEPLERPGLPPRSPAGRWIDVRVELESRDGSAAPVLHDISASFAAPRIGDGSGSSPPPGAGTMPEPSRGP